ncbi:dipeptidase 1-like [Homarus americanus]|uniref:dipeptidase 1-like n=1 Tax=Homarus americanus TaxID=6706 RepID=UPI001C491E84|nr:dipeptidase 1-like [Homarus americanus]
MLPVGLGDVSGYPRLFAELLSDPTWTVADLKKLAGLNLLRVMRKVEKVGVDLRQQRVKPQEEEIARSPEDDGCFYRFTRQADHTE